LHERERRGGGERGCGRRGKEKDGKRKGEKNEKTSKKSFQNRSSLRGHEEVGVAVGEVTDGQADGAEQEEVHRVLCFLFRERMEVEQGKERGEPKKEEADETTSKRKEEKRAASRRELRREKSCVACCLCAMLGLALAVVTRKVAPFESATQRGRSRMRKGAIGV